VSDKLDQEAFKELERFAAARARGATVKLSNMMVMGPASGVAGLVIDGQFFRNHGYIVKIIEPTVLRDWTAEDAKKHVGFVARKGGMFVIVPGHAHSQFVWAGHEYATPVPGTDPAKWDWKPCKVEVPAEKPLIDWKTNAPRLTGLRVVNAMLDVCKATQPNMMIDRGWVARSLADLKSILEQS
jgi:hypothetical protein